MVCQSVSVSRALKISRPTLYRWKDRREKTGSTVPQKGKPPAQSCVIKDWNKFKEFVDANPDKTQKELAQLWGNVSHHTISRGFKKIGYTRKKTYGYQERCEEVRCKFKQKLAQYRPKQGIYIDESGINNNESYPYGWSKKGERLYSTRPGKRQDRLSIIGALCDGKFLAPMVYQGYCTAKVIETWLEKCLLPIVQAGQVIIMDNAPLFMNLIFIKQQTQRFSICK